MKRRLLLLLVAACGDNKAAPPDAPADAACATTISGTVTAPNGTLPLAGVTVYVPSQDPGPLPESLACSTCSAPQGGSTVLARTDVTGHFTLVGVPAGDVPVVIQIGKWRRQLVVPTTECADTSLDHDDTRLPASRTDASPHTATSIDGMPEVDMPRIAVVSGVSDALECFVLSLGVSPSEITSDTGGGHVQLYANRNTGSGPHNARGADHFVGDWPGGAAAAFGDAEALWSSYASLSRYDVIMMGCEGAAFEATKPQSARDAMKQFADAGGRVILSHYQNIWLTGEPAWKDIAAFDPNGNGNGNATPARIDETTSPSAAEFARWLVATGASPNPDELFVHGANYQCNAVDDTIARRWLEFAPEPATGYRKTVELFDFATPVGGPACGHVVFTDLHIAYGSASVSTVPYPTQCSTQALFPQGHALAWLLFGLGDCPAVIEP